MKLLKMDFIDITKAEFTLSILFSFDHAFTPQGVNNTRLLESEPIRLLEIPRLLSEYTPFKAFFAESFYTDENVLTV